MRNRRVIVRLKGGLGNQMFQYAAARSLGIRTGAVLVLDVSSGFILDRVFKRAFSLEPLPINYRKAGFFDQLPFLVEQVRRRFGHNSSLIRKRSWGLFIHEAELIFQPEIQTWRLVGHAWMEGYWQSEAYFSDHADIIASELAVPAPTQASFLKMARTMVECDSVAVGVRLFEEVPGASKGEVGGLVPFGFYEDAASILSAYVKNPVFFVFCTDGKAVRDKLRLPGKIQYVTHDDGFDGATRCLWLISQCKHHILSNSSFYWWGAWMAERNGPSKGVIIASDSFPNKDTIPARWLRLGIGHTPEARSCSGPEHRDRIISF